MNNSSAGFFNWLHKHYPSAHIFIECKNYGKEIENPEFDQLAGRFSPSRGQVGLLICRSVANLDKVTASCIDTCNDNRGYIIVITDDDLKAIVAEYISSNGGSEYPLLRSKFKQLVFRN